MSYRANKSLHYPNVKTFKKDDYIHNTAAYFKNTIKVNQLESTIKKFYDRALEKSKRGLNKNAKIISKKEDAYTAALGWGTKKVALMQEINKLHKKSDFIVTLADIKKHRNKTKKVSKKKLETLRDSSIRELRKMEQIGALGKTEAPQMRDLKVTTDKRPLPNA